VAYGARTVTFGATIRCRMARFVVVQAESQPSDSRSDRSGTLSDTSFEKVGMNRVAFPHPSATSHERSRLDRWGI
jgi:hypothetical protein